MRFLIIIDRKYSYRDVLEFGSGRRGGSRVKHWRIRRINPAFCATVDYRGAGLRPGMTFAGLVHPDDSALKRDRHRRPVKDGTESRRFELHYARKNREIIRRTVTEAMIRDADGRAKSAADGILNIVREKGSEARLKLALDVGKVRRWKGGMFANTLTPHA